ncbi:unnamed protein product [Cylicostephanus goldi]|uniref:Uncharacterized protein n=1 Tax=Cylicostephanus goldi TaxID=71465 RepID=A0A3P7NJJ3_CYLGO|nr:unnamed protein product [Cylicostephanus goldi]
MFACVGCKPGRKASPDIQCKTIQKIDFDLFL